MKTLIKTRNIGNSITNILDSLKWFLIALLSTTWMKLILRIKGVKYGSSIRFFGSSKFKRSNSGSIKIGNNCVFRSMKTSNLIGINRPCIMAALAAGSSLEIGNNCGFSGTVIGCFEKIVIGNNVMFGANTLITDSDWHPEDPRSGKPKQIKIGNNVWLGVNVTVLKGVNIGNNTIIGACSLVSKDVPNNTIAAGNPCKIIKNFSK